ncbi:hypothetical protein VV089_16015 [Candidatus Merdisoma sp. JLR.KK011]|uniref:hypothetical protein n=1 Tax=Candidatus Merdisoma sp. JLR.KK011 TaxID=3114299 RepID=UPI002FF061EC
MDWNDFCSKIDNCSRLFRDKLQYSYDEEKIFYRINGNEYIYTKNDFENIKNKAEQAFYQPYSLITEYQYECLVDFPDIDSRRRFSISFEDKLMSTSIIDSENEITYSFKEASDELIYYILATYENVRISLKMPYFMFESRCANLENKTIFNILRLIIRLPYAILIQCNKRMSKDKLLSFSKSYLFNIAYNLDLVLKPITSPDVLFPKRTFQSIRRVHNVDELMPPKLSYTNELAEQYYMALASSDPFVKFIGFYHILEYFFEDVYNEDLLKNIQNILQHPGFSSKRKKDIIKLVDTIKKKNHQNKEDFQGSELEALELTIRKYINLAELIQDLSTYDSTIIDYYCNHEITFSKGDSINLHDLSNDKLPKKLAARIYKTRNALVHNKSNEARLSERGLYKPFKDNEELSKEIPLMRFLAESIIVNSAESL